MTGPEITQRAEFWVAMIFAVMVKLRASPSLTFWGAIATVVAAVAGAITFTDLAAEWLGFASDGAKFALSALIALTCEHIAREIVAMNLKQMIDTWRGSKQ